MILKIKLKNYSKISKLFSKELATHKLSHPSKLRLYSIILTHAGTPFMKESAVSFGNSSVTSYNFSSTILNLNSEYSSS